MRTRALFVMGALTPLFSTWMLEGCSSSDGGTSSSVDAATWSDSSSASSPEGGGAKPGAADASQSTLSSTDAGESDADHAPAVKALYPLAVGSTWTLQETDQTAVNGTTVFTTCNETTTVTGVSSRDGRPTFLLSSERTCTTQGMTTSITSTNEASQTNDTFETWAAAQSPPQWLRYTDEPVEVGHSWQAYAMPPSANSQENYAWSSHGPATVTAGTFDDCWTKTEVSTSSNGESTLCRGVGPTRGHTTYSGGAVVDWELVSKNF